MQYKKKKLLIILVTLLVFSLGTYGVYLTYTGNMKAHYGAYDIYTGQVEIDDYAFIDNGHAVVTHLKQKQTKDLEQMRKYGKPSVLKESKVPPVVTNQDYVILLNAKIKNAFVNGSHYYRPKHIKKGKGEEWTLLIYKKEGQQLRRSTIDIFQLQKSINDTIEVDDNLVILKNGHAGLGFSLGSGNYCYFDLTSHKVVDLAEVDSSKYSNNNPKPFYNETLYRSLVYPNVSLNRFNNIGLSGKIYDTSFNSKKLKKQESSIPIATKYPKAYQLLLKDNSYLSMMVDDTKANIKVSASVLGLFHKDGEAGVFKNLPISEFNSVDKQAHTVNSYEEFKKFYKTEDTE